MNSYTVPPGLGRVRADKALARAFPEHSRAEFQRSFAAGLVRRAGRALDKSDDVRGGDRIEFEFAPLPASELKAADIPLRVIFEDRHLIAVNKAPGMVVHPGAGTRGDTLVHALLAHCGERLSGIGGAGRPGIVHRLDRGTSGVIIAAKTDAAHRGLAAQFAARTVLKEYLAIVSGSPRLLGGSIREPVGRDRRRRERMSIVSEDRGGRAAHTDWSTIESFGALAALVRCTLHTGRTHQIRVHLKSAGHPLLGDSTYGWKSDPWLPFSPERVMLHAEHLALDHPITGRRLDLRAPLPPDFKRLIAELRKRTK